VHLKEVKEEESEESSDAEEPKIRKGYVSPDEISIPVVVSKRTAADSKLKQKASPSDIKT
jgi:hypothetical protein